MPTINNNPQVLSRNITNDAKLNGLGAQELREMGKALLKAQVGFDQLPAAWNLLENLTDALNMAADEIATNTQDTPAEPGVTA